LSAPLQCQICLDTTLGLQRAVRTDWQRCWDQAV